MTKYKRLKQGEANFVVIKEQDDKNKKSSAETDGQAKKEK